MEGNPDDPYPRRVPLTGEGKAAWTRLTQQHADELNTPDFPDWLRGPWAKLMPGYGGRLALVLQLCRWCAGDASPDAVDERSVGGAGELIAYFKAHARKVYGCMGADPRVREAFQVLAWLTRNPSVTAFSRSDAYADLRRSFETPESLGRPLTLLTHHRFLRLQHMPVVRGPGRRPAPKFEVNPLWDRTANPP
jgi:hypothetical protein